MRVCNFESYLMVKYVCTFVHLIVISNTAIDMSRNNELSKLWKGPRFLEGFAVSYSIREYTRFNKLYSITVFFVIDTDITIQSFLIGILHIYIYMRNFKITRTLRELRYKVHIYFSFFLTEKVRILFVIFESIYTKSSKKYSIDLLKRNETCWWLSHD